jgi:hypothetical protein
LNRGIGIRETTANVRAEVRYLQTVRLREQFDFGEVGFARVKREMRGFAEQVNFLEPCIGNNFHRLFR